MIITAIILIVCRLGYYAAKVIELDDVDNYERQNW